jgi:hypothetical protein
LSTNRLWCVVSCLQRRYNVSIYRGQQNNIEATYNMSKQQSNSSNGQDDDDERNYPFKKSFAPIKYKKAPNAPRRFKSSYMFFSTQKHKEIREERAKAGDDPKVSTVLLEKI